MEGTITIADMVSGNCFIDGDDGNEYFAYQTDVVTANPEDIKVLLTRWRVEFDYESTPKGLHARNVKPPADLPRMKIDSLRDCRYEVDNSEMARVRMDSLSRLYAVTTTSDQRTEKLMRPTVEAEGELRVFWGGNVHLRGFSVQLPETVPGKKAFVLLNPNKQICRPRADNWYETVENASYIVTVEQAGKVTIQKIGRRIQNDHKNSLAISRRFEHIYDFTGYLTKASLVFQTPVSPRQNRARDNDGFVPAIIAGLRLLGITIHADAETVGK